MSTTSSAVRSPRNVLAVLLPLGLGPLLELFLQVLGLLRAAHVRLCVLLRVRLMRAAFLFGLLSLLFGTQVFCVAHVSASSSRWARRVSTRLPFSRATGCSSGCSTVAACSVRVGTPSGSRRAQLGLPSGSRKCGITSSAIR